MPIIKSAKKRVRTAKKAAVRNSKTKRSVRTALKEFATKPTGKSLVSAQSNIDRAAKKGVIHKNKAARLKKRAVAKAKAAGVKPSVAKAKAKPATKPATKPAAKKPAAKKKA
ncbi:30S ribosomal protein S20 [bacterium]|jgi:small subunit ribosomal protein S20|nr:30S ribosomal protein S20 [bacterium]